MKTEGYKFITKNVWRRWVWNRIAEKISDKKNAIILYFAGMEDLDRAVAISKGFIPQNLIAVDIEKNVITSMRAKGNLCIHGDICNVLIALLQNKFKISVIFADFCCGATETVRRFITEITYFQKLFTENAVVCVNAMRGRDNGHLLNSREHFPPLGIFEEKGYSVGVEKHRGKLIFNHMLHQMAAFDSVEPGSNMSGTMFNFYKLADAQFYSYKNKNICMDSFISNIAFNSTTFSDLVDISNNSPYPQNRQYAQQLIQLIMDIPADMPNLRKQITAIRAIRTMRINGTLKPCAIN